MLSEKSLSELADANVVIEVTASRSRELQPGSAVLRLLEEAVRASFAALAVGTELEFRPIAVMQELSERCTTVWFRVSVIASDGVSSQRKEATLRYLTQGTLAFIAWLNTSSNPRLDDLRTALKVLAHGEVLKSSPKPILPKTADLIDAIRAWQSAKNKMREDERVRILFEEDSVELDLTKTISEPALLLPSTQVSNHQAEMILVVEVPDYEGTGIWQLRHGRCRFSSTINRHSVLDEFYFRISDIRPGDALRCQVNIETTYGQDLEVMSEQLNIVEVKEIIRTPPLKPPNRKKSDRTSKRSLGLANTEREAVS